MLLLWRSRPKGLLWEMASRSEPGTARPSTFSIITSKASASGLADVAATKETAL
jgi:hypothetical protein